MKKTFFTLCTFLVLSNLGAQSLQEGINHLYANRFKNAEQTFQKLLAANPNNADATYWLGQTYLDKDDNDAARQLYDKALAANGNNPLLMVGKGHVLLLDKKLDEARQLFETALTTSRTKKGDDPVILNAIGNANVDAKTGNLTYAVEKLEMALQRDPKNADIALNLGNAYRKKDPGQGGGKAFENYKLAAQINPNFAYPYVRIAALFETQKQWDLVLENLNKAIQVDPSFSLAYYELFYYYFFAKQDYAQAEATLNKYIGTRANEDKTEDDYMYSQLCWAKKDWTCAITKAESVKTAMGTKVKPRVYKQLAYSYLGKGDFANAKTNVDAFFEKEKEGFMPLDYQLKADIYTGGGASCEDVYALYMQGAAADTVLTTKLDFMTKSADYFKTKGCKIQEADMRMTIYNTRKSPNPGGLFNLGLNYFQAGNLAKADSLFTAYNTVFPDSVYGYFWRGRTNYQLDTTMIVEPYATNMLRNYQKSLDISFKDKIRYRTQGTQAALLLAGYFNNIKSNRDSALMYVVKGLEIDSTNAQLKSIKEIFDKQPAKGTQKPAGKTTGKPSATLRKPSSKS
ncbi:MAG TPA: tetratricopeptide repeat protein [Chitinophagaceae bacterium]|nr:tetratricopeptide repeat protein [Chitinophagaceae bacterium]